LHASAAIYTVGPMATNPTHLTIQAAIDAALSNPGDDEIRVHTGTYNENLVVTASMNVDTLTISGGWGNGYVSPIRNGAALTVIDPPDGPRAVDFRPSGGLIQLESVTISGAKATSCAGFLLSPSGAGQAAIAYSFVTDNLVDSAGTGVALGGGGCLQPTDTAIALVYASTIARNTARVSGATAGASGGGVHIYCQLQAQCGVQHSVIAQNRIEPNGGQANGAGVYASANGTSLVVIYDSEFRDQEVGGTPTATSGVGAQLGTSDASTGEVALSRFHGSGSVPAANSEELFVQANGTSKAFVDN
jgi:hypothetical protein